MNRHNRRALVKASGISGLIVPSSRATFERRQQEGEIIHELIYKRAQFMAGLAYEQMASQSNSFFKAWANEKAFIDTNWRDFIEVARKDLSKKLANPMIPQDQKDIIYDALCKDRSLPKSHTRHLDS